MLNSINGNKLVISLSLGEVVFASYHMRSFGDDLSFSPLSIYSSPLDKCKAVFRYILILKHFSKFRYTSSHKIGLKRGN